MKKEKINKKILFLLCFLLMVFILSFFLKTNLNNKFIRYLSVFLIVAIILVNKLKIQIKRFLRDYLLNMTIGTSKIKFLGKELKFHKRIFIEDNYIFRLKNEIKGYLKYYKMKEGDIVIDAGAYIGEFSILASKLVGKKGKIISFEPDPSNFRLLSKNAKINNTNNLICINKCLWNSEGILKFNFKTDDSSSPVISQEKSSESNLDYISEIKTTTLDKELKKLKINKVDFIKMDVEGVEIEALEGSKEILRKNEVKLAIATYHLRNREKTNIAVKRVLNGLGYNTKDDFPNHLTTYASKGKLR